ncbi:anti-sigma-D factor RsdA [Mycobacterium colombiense]|uniref:anti-sigma-D factor RsdA n=1 Tax=Mycobacterium colombiense TaxID=339268 RepID=UPI0018C89405|nr:anti-sigma-D factor RsdA [Mycobacterium colombiense]
MTVPESLDEFARTDLLLDALAQRRPVDVEDPDADVLTGLLEDWRDNLRWPPASALVTPEEAVDALRTGLAERRRGRHRGLAVVGSVAAALILLSGFGAMVVEARPGGTLYGLHAMFFDQPQVHGSQEMLAAKADLAKVQESIDRGQWDQAKNQLTEVSSLVQSIDDPASKQELMNQLKLLNAKVDARDPNATLPVASPPAAPPGPATAIPAAPPAASVAPSKDATPAPLSPPPSPSVGKHHHHGHTPPPVAPLAPNQ